MIALVKKHLQKLRQNGKVSDLVFRQGHALFVNGMVRLLSQSKNAFEFVVNDDFSDILVKILLNEVEDRVDKTASNKSQSWDSPSVACLMQLVEELNRVNDKRPASGKKYTREGMIKRVLAERREKAGEAKYRLEFAGNVHGEHKLVNEVGKSYKLTFRDFKRQTGYCSCPDFQTSKLGTCKHLMFAFQHPQVKKIAKSSCQDEYPFVEVYTDPMNGYKITVHCPSGTSPEIQGLLDQYFNADRVFPKERIYDFVDFLREAATHKQILVRPEVMNKVERAFNRRELARMRDKQPLDFGLLKVPPFTYQREGIQFATFREASIIGDEMGLGKTLQAIGTAVMKKNLFGFHRTLVICPASLKDQWKREIEKFSHETATVIEGSQKEREKQYTTATSYFLIVNYETMLRDVALINRTPPDFLIADEAQRIKNFTTLTALAIKSIQRKHALVITGTPIENRLTDLYSIVDFIDPYFLSPLWEFSYQHCFFDEKQPNKIMGYYNLNGLHERLRPLLIRREKREVVQQLPQITELNIPVEMHPQQQMYHADFARGIAGILAKKFITAFDMQKLMLLLSKMRMVCDSTHLIDPETNISPKIHELNHILLEQLDLPNTARKIIIFSEWIRMNAVIGKLLRDHNIGFVELSSKVAVKNRDAIIQEFEQNPACKVFLSTEAGGSGLNLQVADTVINFELPWNPAKKNQRIGRIDRIGQQSNHLTVINLITRNSIEERINTGLALKQAMFDGVLSEGSATDHVDFSAEGRAQFLQQLQSVMGELLDEALPESPADGFVPMWSDDPTEDLAAQLPTETATEPESKPAADSFMDLGTEPTDAPARPTSVQAAPQMAEMELVMNNGLGFIAGLFKMMTGKELSAQDQKVEVNQETGEVTLKFKLPK